jgi:hypothetical protein
LLTEKLENVTTLTTTTTTKYHISWTWWHMGEVSKVVV